MYNVSLMFLLKSLAGRKITYFDLTTYFLDRIKKFDFLLNSFITVDYCFSLQMAKYLDYLVSKKCNTSFLFGVPFAQKDNFCTKGLKTTCGSQLLESFIPSYDSTISIKLKRNNFILVGKTNMDEFSMGSSGENSFFGPTRNPWDLSKIPGGSSSGSAASVAARLIPFSIGSDTGGSVRQPAAYCGIVGFKPTYGLLSRYGLISFSSSLDQVGILCTSVEDCFFVLTNLIDYQLNDLTKCCRDIFFKNVITGLLDDNIINIGVLRESYSEGVTSDVIKAFDLAVNIFKKLGFKVRVVSIPSFSLSLSAYYVFSSIESSSNLLRYDGIRYGFYQKFKANKFDFRDKFLGLEVKRRILLGTYLLTYLNDIDFYSNAKLIQNKLINECLEIFKKVDLILSPTTASCAFQLGEKFTNPLAMYLTDIFTSFVNLVGLPAISIPNGFSKCGLPLGIQLIGNYYREDILLKVAYKYQEQTKWHTCIPPMFI